MTVRVCRWTHPTGLVVDLMPRSEEVLGFSNRSYEESVATAAEVQLPSGRRIRAVAPAMTIATKLEARLGRGGNDVIRSLDVHDIVVLINGRPELADEVRGLPDEVAHAVRHGLAGLLEHPYFDDVIQDAAST